jgi:acetyl esterase/lipase
MRKLRPAALTLVTFVAAFSIAKLPAAAQTAGSTGATAAWEDPANWKSVKPVETDNIVYANVPRIPNPSAEASPNPGTPNGIRTPIPNSGPAGTIDLHLDVYQVPSGKPTPVVIQLHGGGWIRGDRPSSSNSFGAFFAAGMSVVTVQYRNAIDAPAPAAIQDVRCAMAWVKANSRKYNFDLTRVVTWGGSAGGHLALMAGYAPASFNPRGCTDQPKVAAVLDNYGPTNLAEGLTEHGSMDFTHQWLGMDLPLPRDSQPRDSQPRDSPPGDPQASPSAPVPHAAPEDTAATPVDDTAPVRVPRVLAPRWPAPDAATLARAKEMSPLTYIRPGLPPTFIVNGDSDPTVDPTQSAELKKALDTAGVPNGQDLVPGGHHGNFSPAESQKAMLLSLEFLKAQGILQ